MANRTVINTLIMTDEEKEAELEKLLVPIKNLYSEITTRGNKFCYPFIYTDACSIASFTFRNLAVCTYNCICMKGHDKDLASRMQMTDVKTITREQLRQSIVYKNDNYSIDFRQLNVIDDNSFRDIDVKMEFG